MVRTRFAPSPTGYLHIGGVRTALFNWLFARKNGGQFILRIDDTDQGRNNPEALAPILHGLRWCGIDWDEGPEVGGPCGPYYQSEKLARYQQVVQELLDRGLAYHDYATAEELKAEREAAEREKRPYVYSRNWMAATAAERARFEAQGRKPTVRLKMPREGSCRFHDHIRGDMDVPWNTEQDHVIQRADGTCLYHLANIVDDLDMKITHVIRAEEHLSNTPRQIFMIDGLGYPRPEYAHVPFVAEPGSKNKLSKRKIAQYLKNKGFAEVYEHGAGIARALGLATTPESFNPVLAEFYEQVGYFPHAVVNYLLLLGWSYDDKKEEFTWQEMIDLFDLDKVNRAPASFDPQKLLAFQDREMRKVPADDKVALVAPYLVRAGLVQELSESVRQTIRQVVVAADQRIKVAGDILNFTYFFQADDCFPLVEKDVEKWLLRPAEASGLLREARAALAEAEFVPAILEKKLQDLAQARNVKIMAVTQAVRVAVTGKADGFGTYETLAILGRPRCLARIDRMLNRLGGRDA